MPEETELLSDLMHYLLKVLFKVLSLFPSYIDLLVALPDYRIL